MHARKSKRENRKTKIPAVRSLRRRENLRQSNSLRTLRHMKLILIFLSLLFSTLVFTQQSYFPTPEHWAKRTATESGFDSLQLDAAIRFAIENESRNPRSMEKSQAASFGKEPFGEAIGPFADRGEPTGIIIHKGYIIAEWGEPSRVDMTHSVTKSFLSTVVGLAVKRGLIRDVKDTVANYIVKAWTYDTTLNKTGEHIDLFTTEHNRRITWETMLRQTSDWEGTLWGKPDWADRPSRDTATWLTRKRNDPGAVYEYNDVRVNAMALAATMVWRVDLPLILKTYIMDPIGASETWKWHGYKNSWITLDSVKRIQVVSGGGHWGGGMFINAYDMARFGLLTLNKGKWKGAQLIPEQWIKQSLTPTTARPTYGYMNYFINTDKKYYPSAPASAYAHIGNGTNAIYVDPEHDLVIVARWIEDKAMDGFIKRVIESLQ
jgi:CubicO group peptidase (beta-lactamase class C family)